MAQLKRILIQLDPDKHTSSFDAVVAVDSDVDCLLQYSGVESQDVQALVYGAIFTRGPSDLRNTAIFIGGSDVSAGEQLAETVRKTFFDPMRVSVMIDPNGANTTAAAAVLAAQRHADFSGATATVLAATGPVGQRVCMLLARAGAFVRVGSRSQSRAAAVCEKIQGQVENARLEAFASTSDDNLRSALQNSQVLIAAGTAGVELIREQIWSNAETLRVVIDLNAVPPAGIEGIDVLDSGVERHGIVSYGAIGVGGTKMKIHKAAIRSLFEANDRFLDAPEVYAIGRDLESSNG